MTGISNKIIVGTHHKSGTNFFLKFLKALEKEENISLWDRDSSPEAKIEPNDWQVYFDHWSKWVIDLDSFPFKGIHSVRHPFALIYSATLYHLTSDEKWLDVANKNFGGKTYRQMLLSLGSLEEQLIFEMENFSRPVLERMLLVNKDPRFVRCRLENVSNDPNMRDLGRALEWCEIDGEATKKFLDIASRYCIWNTGKTSKHMTTGVDESWKNAFAGKVADSYRNLYGDKETLLGYKKL